MAATEDKVATATNGTCCAGRDAGQISKSHYFLKVFVVGWWRVGGKDCKEKMGRWWEGSSVASWAARVLVADSSKIGPLEVSAGDYSQSGSPQTLPLIAAQTSAAQEPDAPSREPHAMTWRSSGVVEREIAVKHPCDKKIASARQISRR